MDSAPATTRSEALASVAATAATAAPRPSYSEAPERPRKPLPNHDSLSGTTIQGASAVVFGLPFLGVGVGVSLAAADVIHTAESQFPAGRLIAFAAGAIFGTAGTWLLGHGIAGIVRTRGAAAAALRFPESPWRYDRAWKRDGETAKRWRALARPAFGTLLFALFTTVGAALAFGGSGAPGILKAVATLMAMVTMVPAWMTVKRFLQAVRHGRTQVRWERFPAFLGERIALRFRTNEGAPEFGRMVFRLRCVQEAYETTRSGGESTTRIACYALHEAETVLTDPFDMPRPDFDARVQFDLPTDVPGTDLVSRPATWWELEVEGEALGLDYRERFLLPIYARPGSRGVAENVVDADAPSSW